MQAWQVPISHPTFISISLDPAPTRQPTTMPPQSSITRFFGPSRPPPPTIARTASRPLVGFYDPVLREPDGSGRTLDEILAWGDARLEREEKERLEAERVKRLQRLKEQEADMANKNGVRFKGTNILFVVTSMQLNNDLGRGRMKYLDPELRRD